MKITEDARKVQRMMREHGVNATLHDIQTYINCRKRNIENETCDWHEAHETKAYQTPAYVWIVECVATYYD